MKKILVTLVVLLLVIATTAQMPSLQWANKMVGFNSKTLATDAMGNSYMLGAMGESSTLDVDPGPAVVNLNGADGTVIVYKLNTLGQLVWVRQLSDIQPECIQVDADQNVYLAGVFVLTRDFDPGPGVFNQTAAGQNDIFILKLDASGNFTWAKRLGGTQSDLAFSVAISNVGTVYTTGYFIGTSDFDPGLAVTNISSGILGDTYISALDASGNFLWVKQIPGGFNQAHSIAADATGNLLIAGTFSGTKDFDPGASVFNLTATTGGNDIFVLKLSEAGNFILARSVGGTNAAELNESVATDPSGNIYLSGSFSLTGDFDPGAPVFNLTSFGGTDIFILKLDAGANFVWAKQMGSILPDVPNDIATDGSGNVYTTGIFNGMGDFDPGVAVFNLTTHGDNDIFISKLNTNGDFVWAAGFGSSTSEDEGNDISIDASGNVYATGNFQGQVDFDPGPGEAILLNSTPTIFLVKFGSSAAPLPVHLVNFSATETSEGNALQWNTDGEVNTSVFAIQWSSSGQDFRQIGERKAAENSTQPLSYHYLHPIPAGGNNYYRLKIIDKDGQFVFSKIARVYNNSNRAVVVTAFPNPVYGRLSLSVKAIENDNVLFYLVGNDGKIIAARYFKLTRGNNLVDWNLAGVPAGNYYIRCPKLNVKAIQVFKKQ